MEKPYYNKIIVRNNHTQEKGVNMVTTNIKKERNNKSLTQSQLAKKIGVSKQTICDWEKGRSIPNYMKLKLLSEVLEKPIDYLLEQEVDSNSKK